ncbi:glycosyl transferase 2 family protein [Lyngbya aestuarii BL J]|uniref:Glycosyl transferase 2 family protein n=1 Tax=Lyngbya aestuarii BL J TaxID=1348334 RepID=U7QRE8_9CYAN|nr:glycosyltransferase family 2 protein [Lyngbya aestuarii]ERT09700.1 glycosyl transferase 2 family protein [Lyngbya aestuarii BL J]
MQLRLSANCPQNFPEDHQNSLDLDRVIVIIPVLNEETTIATVIKSLQQLDLTQIRVVDNGSIDHSVAEAKQAGAEVFIEPKPGYGRACWRGLQQLPSHIEWILFCDGDGSDDLSELPQFFTDKTTDFILGNRRATSQGRAAMTPVQNFGNGLATFLIHLGWGYRYYDLGPLRLIRRSALESIQMQDRGFGWTVEMQARAVELGLSIREIPVNYHHRQGGKSKISGTLSGSLKAGTIILTTLGKLYSKNRLENTKIEKIKVNYPILKVLSSLLLILGCFWIIPYGDFRQVGAVPQFWIGITLMSLGFILSWGIECIYGIWFWAIAILSRLLLLPMYPGDDVWRYLWEGYIQNLGFNPYLLPPNAPELIPYHTAWWSLINHLDHAAIYPPLTQLGFKILAAISPSILLFKIAFIGADLGICWLLSRRFNYTKTLLYAWNPLIIYTFAGGAHYDSWFILPLVAGCLISNYKNQSWIAVWIGISIAIKWMSLPILCLLAWLQLPRFKSAIMVLLLGTLPLILSAIPFCSTVSCPIIPTGSSFVNNGRSAEFFPFILHLFWQPKTLANSIYLMPLTLVLIGGLLYFQSQKNKLFNGWYFSSNHLFYFSEFYLISLLIVSPIIHAWYFTWLVPFAVVSRNLGTRLVSISAFIYFVLQHRKALGDLSWYLTLNERLLMWLPFILGCVWMVFKPHLFKPNPSIDSK